MGYRVFHDSITLDDARTSAHFTVETLCAHPDQALHGLCKPLEELLAEADALAAQEWSVRRAVVRAHAHVRMADGGADDELRELTKDALAAVRQDRGASLFRLLFPVTPNRIIQMSLAPEMGELQRMVAALQSDETPAALRRKWVPRLQAALDQGRAALEERTAALAGQARASAAAERWIVRVDRERRRVDGALTSYAAHHALPITFNDRFFPARRRVARKPVEARAQSGAPV